MQDKQTRNEDMMTLIHAGEEPGKHMGAVVSPIFMNTLHVFDTIEEFEAVDGFTYGKYAYTRDCNPTVALLEQKIAALEHGKRATVFSSGMAAFSAAVMATCRAGSHIICMWDAYTTVKDALEQVLVSALGLEVTYVFGEDMQEIEDAVRENTALIILESPASACFRAVDLRAIAKIARQRGVKTYIDNSNASPIFQKPLDMGIDISMNSMSKYIGGHSDVCGGVLTTNDDELNRKLVENIRELTGGIMGPMEAWLAIRGMRTMEIRMNRIYETGLAVAEYLEKHPKIRRVHYSGLASHPQAKLLATQQTGHGGLMSFRLDTDDMDEIRAFVNRLKVFQRGGSWGGHESLVLLPFHGMSREELEKMRADEKLIRIYCGLEGSDNLIADLEQALASL